MWKIKDTIIKIYSKVDKKFIKLEFRRNRRKKKR